VQWKQATTVPVTSTADDGCAASSWSLLSSSRVVGGSLLSSTEKNTLCHYELKIPDYHIIITTIKYRENLKLFRKRTKTADLQQTYRPIRTSYCKLNARHTPKGWGRCMGDAIRSHQHLYTGFG
jgi:hypothetical protein